MQKVGIFYGSSTGNTEAAANQMVELLGSDNAQAFDVANSSSSDMEGYSNIIFGCSTWGIGDLQDDFVDFMSEIASANLEGKKIAIFGYGDQDSYPDSFVDAIGEIWEALEGKGCDHIGTVPTVGYSFDESRAEVDGNFVGLPLDEENQANLSDERISSWLNDLKGQFN